MKLLCNINLHKNKLIAYGYPAFSKTWVSVYKCERCGLLLQVLDDLFAEERPSDWPIQIEYMNKAQNE